MKPFGATLEREGFEPSVPYYEYTSLAGTRFRPLSHLSKTRSAIQQVQ